VGKHLGEIVFYGVRTSSQIDTYTEPVCTNE